MRSADALLYLGTELSNIPVLFFFFLNELSWQAIIELTDVHADDSCCES